MRQLLDTPLDEVDCDRLRAALDAAGDEDDRWEAKGGALRPEHVFRAVAVIARKLSLGSQSPGGERRTERLLSAHTTCRLQRRSLHTYLCDLFSAHARGDPAPLLS